ncbi:MAG TPA: STAS domain-containing protein [Luteimonas sp.]
MDIRIQPRDGIAIVAISGSVDGLTAETLLATLQAHVEDGHTRLVVDLAAVEYTSSAGLRALLATVKEARRRGGDLRLAQINPNVRKVLELSGFVTILKIFAEVDEAVESYA